MRDYWGIDVMTLHKLFHYGCFFLYLKFDIFVKKLFGTKPICLASEKLNIAFV